jgi:hypothetical protein
MRLPACVRVQDSKRVDVMWVRIKVCAVCMHCLFTCHRRLLTSEYAHTYKEMAAPSIPE